MSLPQGSCALAATPGPDLFYSLEVTAQRAYRVELTPQGVSLPAPLPLPPWFAAVYLFGSCASPASTCSAGAAISASKPTLSAVLSFVADKNETLLLAVDSAVDQQIPVVTAGKFTLEVEERTLPPNALCQGPQVMVWSNKKAVAKGDTSLSADDGKQVSCQGPMTFDGPQLYYSVALVAKKTYRATLTPTYPFDPALYAFPALTGCSGSAVDAACAATQSAQPGGGIAEQITLSPKATGDWILAVDAAGASAGTFSLEVEELPSSPVCGKLSALALDAAGTVVATGTTVSAADDVTLSFGPCGGGATPGGDVFYSIALPAGKTFTVSVKPAAGFDPALFLFSDCSAPAASCVSVSDSGGTGATEKLTIAPGANATYYIGVDSVLPGGGAFTLSVK